MKNFDIIELCNAGILDITSNELEATDAYNVYKFKKELRKIYKEISENEKDLISQAEIEDPLEFDTNYKKALESKDKDEISKYEIKLRRLSELRKAMLNEEINFENLQKISYSSWHTLQKENADKNVLNGYNEELLENILWYYE